MTKAKAKEPERKAAVNLGMSIEINGSWIRVDVSEEAHGSSDDLEMEVLGRALNFLDVTVNELETYTKQHQMAKGSPDKPIKNPLLD